MISAGNNFEAIAREWIATKSPAWTLRYAKFVVKRLEQDIFPRLGARPIKEITAPELLSVVRLIEKRGELELAHRILQCCGQVFMYGIATGRAERNPASDLRAALKGYVKQTYARLKAIDLPKFLQKLSA